MVIASRNPLEASDPHHLTHLDGLRALLAIYVVAGHYYPTHWPPLQGWAANAWAVALGFLGHAYISVECFIVLSGYLFYRMAERPFLSRSSARPWRMADSQIGSTDTSRIE